MAFAKLPKNVQANTFWIAAPLTLIVLKVLSMFVPWPILLVGGAVLGVLIREATKQKVAATSKNAHNDIMEELEREEREKAARSDKKQVRTVGSTRRLRSSPRPFVSCSARKRHDWSDSLRMLSDELLRSASRQLQASWMMMMMIW